MSVADRSALASQPKRRSPSNVQLAPNLVDTFRENIAATAGAPAGSTGFLFGSAAGGTLAVRALRIVERAAAEELAQGALTGRSPDAAERFASLVASLKADPALAELELAGWCVIRREAGLGVTDLGFHNRYFRRISDVALVVSPERSGNGAALELYSRTNAAPMSGRNQGFGGTEVPAAGIAYAPLNLTILPRIDESLYLKVYQVSEPDGAENGWLAKLKMVFGRGGGVSKPAEEIAPAPFAPPVPFPPAARLPANEVPSAGVQAEEPVTLPTAPVTPAVLPVGPLAAAGVTLMPEDKLEREVASPSAEPGPKADDSPPPPAPPPAEPQAFPPLRSTEEPIVIRPERSRSRLFFWPLLVGVILGVMTAAVAYTVRMRGRVTPVQSDYLRPEAKPLANPFGLGVTAEGDRLVLSWDRNNRTVQTSQFGTLQITDGTQQKTIRLSNDEIGGGAIIYQPRSPDVTFRLELHDAKDKISSSTIQTTGGSQPAVKPPV